MVNVMIKENEPCVGGVVFQTGDASQIESPTGEIRYKVSLI